MQVPWRRAADVGRDVAVPAALGALGVVEVSRGYADHPAGPTALLSVILPMSLVTLRRRQAPVAVALAVTAAVVVLVVGLEPDLTAQPPLTPFLALLVSLFSLGVHGHGPGYRAGALLVLGTLAALQAVTLAAGAPPGDVVPSTVFMGAAFVLGRFLHRSRRETRAERERVRSAVEEERARIAREIHDVLAHALSAITVQASVEARLHDQPDSSAARTLREIERQGRAAMHELRLLLGLLRAEGQGPTDAPLPSIDGVGELVEGLRRDGHRVELDVDLHAAPEPLAAGTSLAAYRVVQEALTNVRRHAPGADVRVSITSGTDGLAVRVEDSGAPAPVDTVPGGHGLAGMRERVRVHGGHLEAGPRTGGGFAVSAVLPTTAGLADRAEPR